MDINISAALIQLAAIALMIAVVAGLLDFSGQVRGAGPVARISFIVFVGLTLLILVLILLGIGLIL